MATATAFGKGSQYQLSDGRYLVPLRDGTQHYTSAPGGGFFSASTGGMQPTFQFDPASLGLPVAKNVSTPDSLTMYAGPDWSGTGYISDKPFEEKFYEELHEPGFGTSVWNNAWNDGQGPLTVLLAFLGAGAAGGMFGGAGAGAEGLGAGAGAFDAGGLGAAESMGLGAGYSSPALAGGAGVDMTGFMSEYNPFGFGGDGGLPSYGNLSGYTTGDFTASQLPGGALNGYSAAGTGGIGNPFSMIDLGGGTTGSIPGVNLGGGGSWFDTLKNKVGEQAAKSVLSKITNGTATADDYLKVLGQLGAAGLGAYGANQQANSLNNLASTYLNLGAPARARFEASMQPGFDPSTIPGYAGALDTSSKALLARLSASGGNPFGNPGAMIDANKAIIAGTALPAINEYQRLNLAAGGQANLNAAVPSLQQQAIGQEGNMLNAFGYGLNQLTNPTQPQLSISDIARAFGLPGVA